MEKKFENKTKENIKVRVSEIFGARRTYKWLTVKPSEKIVMSVKYGRKLGLTPVGEKPKVVEPEVVPERPEEISVDLSVDTDPKASVDPVDTDEDPEVDPDEFKKSLTEINGIGAKTALDIMKVFPTEKDLQNKINEGKELPFDDDISDKLIKRFR